MSYEQFAQVYDKLMDKSLYKKWAKFVQKYAPPQSTIVDMACGGGDLAQLLESNYRMIGCDLSEYMLSIASEKTKKTLLINADMTNFSLETSVDVVTCFADSLCYLKDEHAMCQAFKCAYNCLKDKGYYLFDVHSIYQMTQIYPDMHFHYVDDNTVFTWRTFVGDYAYSIEHDLTCLNQLSNGLYERYDETHYERTYHLEQYKQWLLDVGFKTVDVFSDFGQNTVDDTTTRWFFVCQK